MRILGLEEDNKAKGFWIAFPTKIDGMFRGKLSLFRHIPHLPADLSFLIATTGKGFFKKVLLPMSIF